MHHEATHLPYCRAEWCVPAVQATLAGQVVRSEEGDAPPPKAKTRSNQYANSWNDQNASSWSYDEPQQSSAAYIHVSWCNWSCGGQCNPHGQTSAAPTYGGYSAVSKPKAETVAPVKLVTVMVEGLPFAVGDSTLKSLFEEHGAVHSVKVFVSLRMPAL